MKVKLIALLSVNVTYKIWWFNQPLLLSLLCYAYAITHQTQVCGLSPLASNHIRWDAVMELCRNIFSDHLVISPLHPLLNFWSRFCDSKGQFMWRQDTSFPLNSYWKLLWLTWLIILSSLECYKPLWMKTVDLLVRSVDVLTSSMNTGVLVAAFINVLEKFEILWVKQVKSLSSKLLWTANIEHPCFTCKQLGPVNPSSQIHRYPWRVSSGMHLASFLQGLVPLMLQWSICSQFDPR